jgi:uncharacterized protein (TIGR02246 family)
VSETRRLHQELLESWNRHDAAAFAALFADDGHVVGFDGSEMHGRAEIESELSRIFADHETATYVAKVRGEESVTPDVTVLHAVAGMVPPGKTDLNPAVNAVQTLVAAKRDRWRIVLFQNTPAQLHGRPDLSEALTAELRHLLPDSWGR